MKKLIYGVGFNTKRKHKTRIDNKMTKVYKIWCAMLQRCYDPKVHLRQPTYIGCSVSEEWHDFQDFADWYCEHELYGLSYHLDKDVLLPNNKIYSPENCCLIPQELNNLLNHRSGRRGEFPQGVYWSKLDKKYKAKLMANGKAVHLGYFKDANEAHQVYKAAKERNVKDMAIKLQDRIEAKVFNTLMNWSL